MKRTDFLQNLPAVLSWHVEIEEDQSRHRALIMLIASLSQKILDQRFPVSHEYDGVEQRVLFENRLDEKRDVLIVIGQNDRYVDLGFRFHKSSLRTAVRLLLI